MLKEPIEVSFFAIQANFRLTDINFNEVKFDKKSLKLTEAVCPENQN